MVKKFSAQILLLFALLLPLSTMAVTAIFYQPQESDKQIPSQEWRSIFHHLKKKGFDTLVIQWTQYGDFLKSAENQAWLKERVDQATGEKLQLIIGLSSDPEMFNRLKEPSAESKDYLTKLSRVDLLLVDYWNKNIPQDKIAGWYIPLEIDDRAWRDPKAFDILRKHLRDESQKIRMQSEKPIYISSFFTGNMSPDDYSKIIASLHEVTGLHIWIQDGAGTGKLNPSERALYLVPLTKCSAPIASGLIFEAFKQTQHDQTFAAESLPPQLLAQRLKLRAPCQLDSVFFELRYLFKDSFKAKT